MPFAYGFNDQFGLIHGHVEIARFSSVVVEYRAFVQARVGAVHPEYLERVAVD